jgi:hypothetical protein
MAVVNGWSFELAENCWSLSDRARMHQNDIVTGIIYISRNFFRELSDERQVSDPDSSIEPAKRRPQKSLLA